MIRWTGGWAPTRKLSTRTLKLVRMGTHFFFGDGDSDGEREDGHGRGDD